MTVKKLADIPEKVRSYTDLNFRDENISFFTVFKIFMDN